MRWKLAIMIRVVASMLIPVSPLCLNELRSSELGGELRSEFVANDNCQDGCGLVCSCEPQTIYSVRTDFLWLGRGSVDPNNLILTPADAPTTPLLRTSDLQFDVGAGVDIAVRALRRTGRTWELRYFGIYDQQAIARRTYTDGDAITTNDATVAYFGNNLGSNTDLTTNYSSDLNNVEANIWLREIWGFEPVVGLRWVRQDEDLGTYITNNLTEGTFTGFENNLYGAQVGLRRVLWERQSGWRCSYRVEATLKGCAFHNSMQFDSEVRTLGITTPTFDRSFSSMAYGGELGITAVLQFCPWFSMNIGYTGLWLDRVGLAADQLDNFNALAGTGNVDLTTLIYQGGHVGFEIAW